MLDTNGRNDWAYTGPLAHGLDLAMDPTDPETIYLGAFAQGLFKSTDGFDSWENIREGNKLVIGLAINPDVSNELLISEFDITTGTFGVYKSIDAGDSWYKTSEFVANDIVYTENDTIYFSHENGVFMSEDNGETLPLVPTYLSGELVLSLAYSAPYLYAGTEEGLLYKIDQTGGIAEITGPWNGDKPTAIHNLLYAGNSIIVGLSGAEQDALHNLNGGVWQSIDDGETWVDITGNMTNTNVFGNTGLAIDENGNVLAATYGLGIFQSNDLVLSMDEAPRDTDFSCFPNPASERILIQALSPISSIAIQDLSGKTVMVYEANNSNEITINVQEMTAGIYTLTVHVENKTLVKKLIIQ